jgi:hypothetical protein
MRSGTTVPLALVCLSVALAGIAGVAPQWTRASGLDFWNHGAEEAHLRTALEASQVWDGSFEQVIRRTEVTNQIATRLIEQRVTLDEALESVAAVLAADPDWFAFLRQHYRDTGVVPPSATDRDVMAAYLLNKVRRVLREAEASGEPARAALLSARVIGLEEEARLLSAAPLPVQLTR